MRQLKFLPVLLLFLFVTGCVKNMTQSSTNEEAWWLDGKWPQEKSDLPRHDKAVYGRLDNGLRYIIQPNKKPEDRVTVNLNIQVGSLMERENERGLAHFIEHLAFNGSKNFAPGELIPFLQKNGMSFGRDANAHTSLMETVYKLNLASNKENVNTGLLFMRDVADGMTILPEEVESERGVILSEKAARDSEQYRAAMRMRKFLFPDARFKNDTIGTEEVITTASTETIRDFYGAWYRPELMVLIVVGSVDPTAVEADIKKLFGDLAPHGERRVLENWGDAAPQGVVTYHDTYDTEFTVIRIGTMKPRIWQNDSVDLQRRMLLGVMANSIVSKRLRKMVASGDAPFLNAHVRESDFLKVFPSADIIARTESANWEKSIVVLQDELRRTLKHGFLPEEVKEARIELLRSYGRRARFESQIPNDQVAETMIGCFNANRVYQSWGQTYAMYKQFLNEVTAEDLHTVFRGMWNTENRILSVMGNAVIKGDSNVELTKLWSAGNKRPVKPLSAVEQLDYPYVKEPETQGEVVSSIVKDVPGSVLKLHEVVFENGLVLRMLPTPYLKDRSSLSLHVGGGTDTLSDNEFIAAKLAVDADKESGFGRLTKEEAKRLFLSKGYGARVSIGTESLEISGGGETKDMRGILQAMWTQYRDPVIEEKDRQSMLRNFALADAARQKNVSSVIGTAARELFFGKSIRNTPITADEASSISLNAMQHALREVHAGGKGVLNIIGDFDPAKAQVLVAGYFGASEVKWRELAASDYAVIPEFAADGNREKHVVADSKLNQAGLRVAYLRPLKNPEDRKTLATRRLLGSIIRDRLRVHVREELGAAYSPSLFYWANDVNGHGLYLVRIGTQPDKLVQLQKAVERVIREVVEDGVHVNEIERQLRPMIRGWEDVRSQNTVYSSMLKTTARRNLPYFAWHAEYPELLRSVTVEALNTEARAAFRDENKAVLTGTELQSVSHDAAIASGVE